MSCWFKNFLRFSRLRHSKTPKWQASFLLVTVVFCTWECFIEMRMDNFASLFPTRKRDNKGAKLATCIAMRNSQLFMKQNTLYFQQKIILRVKSFNQIFRIFWLLCNTFVSSKLGYYPALGICNFLTKGGSKKFAIQLNIITQTAFWE